MPRVLNNIARPSHDTTCWRKQSDPRRGEAPEKEWDGTANMCSYNGGGSIVIKYYCWSTAVRAQEFCRLRLIKQRQGWEQQGGISVLGSVASNSGVKSRFFHRWWDSWWSQTELLFLFNFPNLAAGIWYDAHQGSNNSAWTTGSGLMSAGKFFGSPFDTAGSMKARCTATVWWWWGIGAAPNQHQYKLSDSANNVHPTVGRFEGGRPWN